MAKSKKYVDASRRYDKATLHQPAEAIELIKSMSTRNFDETVEAAFRLGVDPRKADQMLRGTVSLPAGTGKDVKVAVFAQGDAAQEARDAGADVVGADDLVDRVSKGFMDFDIAIATPDLMGQVGKLGRVLGPRGLMPNPKTGTVTTDVGKTVGEFKGGKVEYRTDRNGNVHVPIGKASFPVESLSKNYGAVLDELIAPSPPRRRAATSRASRRRRRWAPASRSPPRQRSRRSASRPTTKLGVRCAGAGSARACGCGGTGSPRRRGRCTWSSRAPAANLELDAVVGDHLDELQRLVAAREGDFFRREPNDDALIVDLELDVAEHDARSRVDIGDFGMGRHGRALEELVQLDEKCPDAGWSWQTFLVSDLDEHAVAVQLAVPHARVRLTRRIVTLRG